MMTFCTALTFQIELFLGAADVIDSDADVLSLVEWLHVGDDKTADYRVASVCRVETLKHIRSCVSLVKEGKGEG